MPTSSTLSQHRLRVLIPALAKARGSERELQPKTGRSVTEAKSMMHSSRPNSESLVSGLSDGYRFPDPLPRSQLSGLLARAEDTLARFDERLRSSTIREGWIARSHFSDAAASLWIEGELVHVEDLVLHDAGMNIRTPTHELTRADAVLRARRRIADAEPDRALTRSGLDELRDRPARKEGRPDRSKMANSRTTGASNRARTVRIRLRTLGARNWRNSTRW